MDDAIEELHEFGRLTNAIAATIFVASAFAASWVHDGKDWWMCDGDTKVWTTVNAKDKLENKIGVTVKEKIQDLRADDELRAEGEKMVSVKQWKAMFGNVGTRAFLKGASAFCKDKLTQANFSNKLDMNTDLVPLKDGQLFDRETRTFREITPEDNVSKVTTVTRAELEDPTKQFTEAELKTWVSQVYPADGVAMLWLYLLAGALYCADWEIFVMLAGAGGAGKSVGKQIISFAFGELHQTLKPDILMGKGTSNGEGAQSFLMSCKGCRIVISSEPCGKNPEFDPGCFRTFASHDEQSGRGLYREATTFKNTYMPWMLSNWPAPAIPVPEGSINESPGKMSARLRSFSRRLYLIQHTVEFSEGGPFAKDEVKRKMGVALLKWLIGTEALDYLQGRDDKPPEVPESVQVASQAHLEGPAVIVKNFIETKCEKMTKDPQNRNLATKISDFEDAVKKEYKNYREFAFTKSAFKSTMAELGWKSAKAGVTDENGCVTATTATYWENDEHILRVA